MQDATAVAWTCLCMLMVYQTCAKQLGPHQVQLLWTFFQPVLPLVLMLVLYAQATAYFEQHHIMHADCFPEQQRRYLAPAKDLYAMARVFTCLCATCLAACAALIASKRSAMSAAALAVPPVMYATSLFILLVPGKWLRRTSRSFFCTTLWRVLVPFQPVTWADFLLADILTSLAKSSSDLARSICLMLHGEVPLDNA